MHDAQRFGRIAGMGWLAAGLVAFGGCTPSEPPGPTTKSAEPSQQGEAEPVEPVAPSPPADDAARRETLRTTAHQLTEAFGARLKKRLKAGLEEGGPGAAIEVCKLEAPKIAASVPGEQGLAEWQVGRTAMKVRNPDNAPNAWQRAQLEAFEARIEAEPSVEVAAMQWDAVAESDGKREWRYMRAIPTGGVCLTCHGDPAALPPPVKAKLAELYPDDQATGFEAGALRGAFVITAPF